MSKFFCLPVSVLKNQNGSPFGTLGISSVFESFCCCLLVRCRKFGEPWKGDLKNFSETLCLQVKFREGALLAFLKVSGTKKLCETGVSWFFMRKFCLIVPKCFAGEPSCVSETFWYRQILYLRGGITIIRLTVPKIFVQGIFWCLWVLACVWHRLHCML